MVDAAASFFEEFADRRVITGGFQQLDAALADRQYCDTDILILHDLGMYILQSEGVCPECQCLVDAFCRYSKMIDLHNRGFFSSSFTAEYGSRRLSATSVASCSSFSPLPFRAKRSSKSLSRSNSVSRQRAMARRR